MTPESTRVHRDAQGRWECRPYLGTDRVTGKRVRPSRTWPAEWDRERAQAACDAWLAEIAPAETGIVSRRLGSMLADYIEDPLNGFAGNTVATYRSILRTCVEPTIGDVPYDELKAHEVRTAYGSLLRGWRGRPPIAPATLHKMHVLLKGAYSQWCRAMGGRNPMLAVPAPKVIAAEPFALYDTDLERLNRSIRAGLDTRGHALGDVSRRTVAFAAYLALNGGFRIGEVCALQRCDWRREGHDVHVGATVVERPRLARQPHTKGKVARNVSMPPRVEREIERHIGWQDGWVNQNRTGPLTPLVTLAPTAAIVRPTVLTARFTALVRELGLPEGTTFHTLRHTHATWLFMHGFDARTVQERLGHADVATTLRIYGSVMPGRDAEAARAFAESMEEGETDADS